MYTVAYHTSNSLSSACVTSVAFLWGVYYYYYNFVSWKSAPGTVAAPGCRSRYVWAAANVIESMWKTTKRGNLNHNQRNICMYIIIMHTQYIYVHMYVNVVVCVSRRTRIAGTCDRSVHSQRCQLVGLWHALSKVLLHSIPELERLSVGIFTGELDV